MGCYKKREMIRPKHNFDDCVVGSVKKIIEAQDVVDRRCSSGCEHSIQQLRGNPEIEKTTIPFILYCKDNCKPFVGTGVYHVPSVKGKNGFFSCIESPIFRAKHFVENSKSCVKLELILPISGDDCVDHSVHRKCDNSVCSFFPDDHPITDFLATGICLTVDLENFLGISCLEPINPII